MSTGSGSGCVYSERVGADFNRFLLVHIVSRRPALPCPQPPVIDFFYCVTTEIVKLHCSGFKLKHPQLETPLAIITALSLQTWIYNRDSFLRHSISGIKMLATWNLPWPDETQNCEYMIHIKY